MNAIIEMPDANQETCTHDEWMWDEGDRFCLICGKNLSGGVNWAELARLERQHEAELEALADSYEPEDAADDTPGNAVSLEESAASWQAPADYSLISFSFESFMENDTTEHALYMND